jgi:hypothetical protein
MALNDPGRCPFGQQDSYSQVEIRILPSWVPIIWHPSPGYVEIIWELVVGNKQSTNYTIPLTAVVLGMEAAPKQDI